MKIRRLSEIDLARFCVLEGDALRHALRLYNAGGGSWSYGPVRNSTPDILNASTPLLGTSMRTPWTKLSRQIEKACTRGEAQIDANLEAGSVLYHLAEALGWQAVNWSMGRLAIGLGEAVRYWSDVVVDDGDGPFIPFFDHRREHGITNVDVRRIVFSLQDIHVRQQHPDLADARLAVVRFPSAGALRTMSLDFDEGIELIGFDQLDAKVAEVYRLWAEVTTERDTEKRRTGTGGSSPLGF